MSEPTAPNPSDDTPRKGKPAGIRAKGEWRFPVAASFVRSNRLSVPARFLFILLKSYVGPQCLMPFPSLETLALQMGMHRESVQKYLRELEDGGRIKRHQPTDSAGFKSTHYTLVEEARRGKSPLREKTATKSYHTRSLISPPLDPEPMHPSSCDCCECRSVLREPETAYVVNSTTARICANP